MMRQCMDSENLHRRLNKIIGQVNAINKMIDKDIPCEDILMQINAAKSALHKVGQIVLEFVAPKRLALAGQHFQAVYR